MIADDLVRSAFDLNNGSESDLAKEDFASRAVGPLQAWLWSQHQLTPCGGILLHAVLCIISLGLATSGLSTVVECSVQSICPAQQRNFGNKALPVFDFIFRLPLHCKLPTSAPYDLKPIRRVLVDSSREPGLGVEHLRYAQVPDAEA